MHKDILCIGLHIGFLENSGLQTVCRRNLSVACCEFKSLKSLEPLGLNHLDDVLHSALEADECADVQVEST